MHYVRSCDASLNIIAVVRGPTGRIFILSAVLEI